MIYILYEKDECFRNVVLKEMWAFCIKISDDFCHSNVQIIIRLKMEDLEIKIRDLVTTTLESHDEGVQLWIGLAGPPG